MTEADKKEEPVFPVFVFIRRHDIEIEGGFILAGNLVLNIPKPSSLQLAPTADQEQMIQAITARLSALARSGQMPADAFMCGWANGVETANAVDVHNDALMTAWAEKHVVISVRIEPYARLRVTMRMRKPASAGSVTSEIAIAAARPSYWLEAMRAFARLRASRRPVVSEMPREPD